MLISTIVMGTVAVILLIIGYKQGQHVEGLKTAGSLLLEIFPVLIFAFIVAGMMQVLMPDELIQKWIGVHSGARGILIGSIAGAFSPGGPFVSMPIAASLVRSGASIGTMVAFLTGWSLWALTRLPIEIGILGWRLTAIRLLSIAIFPPAAGFIAQFLATLIK